MKENQNAASFDFETFTDKNVMECDLPELEVCYKDIDCQILKDICVDEGRPERDINVIESFNDEKPGLLFPEPPNEKVHFEAAEDSSQECTNNPCATQCGSKDENDGEILVSEEKLESSLDDSFDPENSVQIGEANCGTTGKAETDSKDICEGNNVTQPPDQILNGKTGSESPDASSTHNSKVESRIITFNFNSPGPVVVDSGVTASADEQCEHSAESAEAVIKEHSAESADAVITENVQEQLVNIVDRNSDGGSAQQVGSEDSSGETAHESKDATNDNDSTSDDPVLISNNQNVQAVEPKAPQHERSNSSGHASVVNQSYRDAGETSFSAASLISYSGPIAFSGSLSHRSDGSTTSAKSFAFPVYTTC